MKQKRLPQLRHHAKDLHRMFCEWELQTRTFAHAIRQSARSKSNLRKAKLKMERANA